MKINMPRADFVTLIGKIQSVVPIKPSTSILTNILIQAEGSQLTISATDGVVSMRIYGQGHVQEPGAIALPARHLFQLARELTTPEIVIEATSADVGLICSGTSHFKIQGMHKSEFPCFPDFSEGFDMVMKAETLRAMFTRTAFAAAKDDARQTLNGILMQRVDSLVTFVGTDGKRLARNRLDLKEEITGSGSYIFPLKAVEEIVKMLNDKEESVKLTVMPKKLAVEADRTILMTQLLSGQYPDISRVIPERSDASVTLHRNELISLLRQVALFTSESTHSVHFTFDAGILQLSVASKEIGEGKVSMPVNYAGPKLDIAFNPQSFLDILRHSKDETIQFAVSDSYTPGLITDSSEAEFIIMPMRLHANAP